MVKSLFSSPWLNVTENRRQQNNKSREREREIHSLTQISFVLKRRDIRKWREKERREDETQGVEQLIFSASPFSEPNFQFLTQISFWGCCKVEGFGV